MLHLVKDSRHAGSIFGSKIGQGHYFGYQEAAKMSFRYYRLFYFLSTHFIGSTNAYSNSSWISPKIYLWPCVI